MPQTIRLEFAKSNTKGKDTKERQLYLGGAGIKVLQRKNETFFCILSIIALGEENPYLLHQ